MNFSNFVEKFDKLCLDGKLCDFFKIMMSLEMTQRDCLKGKLKIADLKTESSFI